MDLTMIQIVLLRNGHTHPKGFPTGLAVPNSDVLFANLGTILDKLKAGDPDNLKNAYYTVAHHTGLGGGQPTRTEVSFDYQTVLPFDIDAVDQSRAWDYLPIVARILGVSQQSLIFSSSGNGLHILAHLKTPVRSSKYLKETKPHYNELVYRINSALRDAALPGHADPVVWDAARILRLPNTVNESKKGVKESKLLQYPGLIALDLDLTKLSGLDKIALENIGPQVLKKTYPRPDFPEVATQCGFMKWVVSKPEEVHEPQFMAAVGLLGAMSPGDKANFQGKECTPKELAAGVFDSACNSKSLARGDFDRKWEHGIRYGAPKCSTISGSWVGGCEQCPHFQKVNTPLALKSPTHISSSVNGYWVLGRNGPLHPHYSDTAKLFSQERAYVTCEPDRLFTFEQTHYRATGQLTVKAWLEKKVGFEEHLRESHCVEFVKKVMRSNALTEPQELELFEKAPRGKLNCQNGAVDVVTGEVSPHSPAVGFKYVLPYDFEPGQVSGLFLDWLAEMMQNRVELMEAVLDMMAYTLWPGYDDHVFAYFVGEGRNGKSTLLHLVQELVGRANYSAISLAQLGGNRFAPANLEGMLVNVSEESGGNDLSLEELNIIKDLSAGGEMQVEHKGQKPFMLRNRAKLIFSANKTPRFHEHGRAIRSRLLVIPFDHTIAHPDANVEKALIAEVPKICSMLVTRIQEILRANRGRFKVSRGGQTALTAQDRVLLAGNSVVEWANECIESSVALPDGKYIVVSDAYTRYSHWAQANNYRPSNSSQFGHMMTHGILPAGINSKVAKVAGKNVRVYPHTQWKEEA